MQDPSLELSTMLYMPYSHAEVGATAKCISTVISVATSVSSITPAATDSVTDASITTPHDGLNDKLKSSFLVTTF